MRGPTTRIRHARVHSNIAYKHVVTHRNTRPAIGGKASAQSNQQYLYIISPEHSEHSGEMPLLVVK
jgi:hypothetical protein